MSNESLPTSGAAGREQREKLHRLTTLLNSLDARDAHDAGRLNRRSVRAPFRRHGVQMLLFHPGGSSTRRQVLTRDLSAGGLSFIHSGYLHVRTRCEIVLPRHSPDSGEDQLSGEVMTCAHLAGNWHTVGVKFDERVDPKRYLDPTNARDHEVEPTRPEDLHGRVLLLDGNELDRRLVAHHLRQSRVALVGVATLREAGECLASQKENGAFDLVLVDPRLEGDEAELTAADVVRRLTDAGAGQIVLCMAEDTDAPSGMVGGVGVVEGVGVVGGVTKPIEADALLAGLGKWLGVPVKSDSIYSTLVGQSELRPLLREFVAKVHKLVPVLKQSCDSGDHARCRAICQTLHGSGAGYGFQAVSDAAGEALQVLEATTNLWESLTPLQRLQDVCRRITDAEPNGDDRIDAILAA